MSEPLSVYVVDDDPGILQAVLAILGRPAHGFQLLGASPIGDSAPELVADGEVDIFVCDWRLPGADGLDLLVRAKELRPAVRTVLMTGFPSSELSLRAFVGGADALLHKPFHGPELLASLRAACHGQRSFCAEAAGHLAALLRAAAAPGQPAPAIADTLAPREAELMRWLSQGKTLKEAADLMAVTEATVATYRKRAYEKLKAHKLNEALTKFRGGRDPARVNGRTDPQ